jgi:hypothetical protein
MRNPHGYVSIIDSDGIITKEYDVFVCNHCQAIMDVKVKENDIDWCGRCNAPICSECHKIGKCAPFEKVLEKIESHDRFCRSIGL